MKVRAMGVIGQDDKGHVSLELKSGEGAEAIRSHLGEEVELIIVTKETAAQSPTSERKPTGLSACASPKYWNVEDQE